MLFAVTFLEGVVTFVISFSVGFWVVVYLLKKFDRRGGGKNAAKRKFSSLLTRWPR